MNGRIVRRFGATATLCLLVACGGIEGTGSTVASIEGTGASSSSSSGSVTGFGSVFVNGIEYATDRAEIVIDGGPESESALQVGMVVTVAGDTNTDGVSGVAQRVEFDRPLFGPIDTLDREARSLVVLGQTVLLDDASLLGGFSEDELQEGQSCLVSGHFEASRDLRATLLSCAGGYAAGVTIVEAEGLVSQLDTGASTFRVRDLIVSFTAAALDTRAAPLSDGALVEVIGVQTERRGRLNAQRLRVKRADLKNGQAVLLEGVIGRFASLADFDIDRSRVNAASAERSDNSGVAPATGVRILVRGVLRDNVIAADRYLLLPLTDIQMTGRVDRVDAASERLTLFGSDRQALTVTQYQDSRSNGQRRFRIADLQPNDYVQLRGFRDAQGRAAITRIERRDEAPPEGGTIVARFRIALGPDSDPSAAVTRGPLDRFDGAQGTLVIAGVNVKTDLTRTEFFDRNGAAVTGAQFYNGLQPGDRLEAEGNEASDVIQALRVRYVR